MKPIKKIILISLTISLAAIFSISYVCAQTVSFGSSNGTLVSNLTPTFSFSNGTGPITNQDSTIKELTPVGTVNVSSLPKLVKDQTYHVPHAIPFLTEGNTPQTTVNTESQSFVPRSFSGTNVLSTTAISNPVSISSGSTDGLNQNCSNCGFVPPDVQVAVGPNHVEEMVNLEGEIWTKQGTQLTQFSTFSLNSFFSTGSDTITDPKIFYDSISNRWFTTIADTTANKVMIAVSQTNDPTKSWTLYADPFVNCPDRPETGVSSDKFVLSVNLFTNHCNTPTFAGAEYDVVNKTQLISGTSAGFQPFGPDSTKFSIRPAQSLSSTLPLYMVSVHNGVGHNQVEVYTLTGTTPNVSSSQVNLSIRTINQPQNATQPSTSVLLNVNDGRVLDAVWNQGKLWFSLNDGCTPNGDTQTRSCARLIETDTTTQKRIQDFDINKTSTYYFYPSLRTDGFGGIVTIFGISNSTVYPSLLVTGQAAFDLPNSTRPVSYLKVGSQPDTDTGNLERYGDYFGAGLDPSNSTLIWTAGEYYTISSHTWSTFIGSIVLDCVPPSSGDWIITSNCTLANSATVPGNVIINNNSLLMVPSGTTLSIDFTRYHLLVNSGSGVLVQPGGRIA